MNESTIDLEEAAKFLGISQERLRQKAKNGQIPGAFKIGKPWMFYLPSLEQYVSQMYTTYTTTLGGIKCLSARLKTVHTTTQDSRFAESEFKNLRLQLTNKKPKSLKKSVERKSVINS